MRKKSTGKIKSFLSIALVVIMIAAMSSLGANAANVEIIPVSEIANSSYGIWFEDGAGISTIALPNVNYKANNLNSINVSNSGTYYYAFGSEWNLPENAPAVKIEVINDIVTATAGHIVQTWWPNDAVNFVEDELYSVRVLQNRSVVISETDDYPNTFEDAHEMWLNDIYGVTTKQGELERNTDVDIFAFYSNTYTPGGKYTVYSSDITTDVKAEIYNRAGELLYSDDNSGGNSNFEMVCDFVSPNMYYIVVSHTNLNGAGSYTLNIKYDDAGDTILDARTVTVTGSDTPRFFINHDGDVDVFKFTAETAGSYRFYGLGEDNVDYTVYNELGVEVANYSTIVPLMSSPYHDFTINLAAGETCYVKAAIQDGWQTGTYQFCIYNN